MLNLLILGDDEKANSFLGAFVYIVDHLDSAIIFLWSTLLLILNINTRYCIHFDFIRWMYGCTHYKRNSLVKAFRNVFTCDSVF